VFGDCQQIVKSRLQNTLRGVAALRLLRLGFESRVLIAGVRRGNVIESVFIFVCQRKIGHLDKA
jgi:hypothetical protein